MSGKLPFVARATFVLVLLAILLAAAASALTRGAEQAEAAKPCWKRLVDDWSQDGRIDGTYSARCVEEALAKVPEDIRAYSDFEEQAKAARLDATRSLQGAGSGSGGGGGSGSGRGLEEREPNTDPNDDTPVQSVLGTRGNNADSIPLPLLVLLVLASALVVAGTAGFAARKLKAHRTPPAA